MLAALQHRLGELEAPVAEHAPDEAVGGVGGVVETVGFDRRAGFRDRLGGLAENPAVERLARRLRIETGDARATVHLGEARGVPQLGGEVAVALDAALRQLDVAPLRRHRRQREAQRVGAETVDEVERIDDVALRLRHLRALLVADEGVDVDVAERHLAAEMQAHHHHPRDPEEDDVEAGDQRAGRIVAVELGRLVGPAERRERPQRRGEPGVEHVGIARRSLAQVSALT